ncbi:MAG: hypothetical protein ABIU54_06020 [Candidatus Eisenbacteria bacterium]
MKIIIAIVGLALFGALATAQAAPVDVVFSVSGSTGNWLLDFSVTNNLGGTNNLYLFGVYSPPRDVAGSPAGWDPNAVNAYNPGSYGGTNTNYDNLWITGPGGVSTITTGHTLAGFQVKSTAITMPSAVKWMAVSSGGTYLGAGCSFICGPPYDNPGFEGVAAPAAVGVGDAPSVGVEFALAGSNPLRGAAEFGFALPEAGHVAITVHDLAGRVVATLLDGEVPAGRRSVTWPRGASAPPGVYFARMWTAGRTLVRTVVVLK